MSVEALAGATSTACNFGGSHSDTSTINKFRTISPPGNPRPANVSGGKQEESINQRCDLMYSEQINHLKDLQSSLSELLTKIETCDQMEAQHYQALAASLYDQAQHGTLLISVIHKMQQELFHTRRELSKLLGSMDHDLLGRTQERVKWLETRIEKVLLYHRQHVLDSKRAKAVSNSSQSIGSSLDTTLDIDEELLAVEKGPPKSVRSQRSKTTTISTVPPSSIPPLSVRDPTFTSQLSTKSPTARSILDDTDSMWGGTTKGGKLSANQPLWHTLPLVPRSPLTIPSVPFNRTVPWLDRKGSSYDLLREEYDELMDKVGKVYEHIQKITDSSHETDVRLFSATQVSSRLSRPIGDTKEIYDCYGLDPPRPLKWTRLSRSEKNVYPRKTTEWHNGVYIAPVRRIANQQQTQQQKEPVKARALTPAHATVSYTRLTKVKTSVMANISLQRIKGLRTRENAAHIGKDQAQRKRLEFLMEHNLQSDVAKVRKEAARDLGVLYKSSPSYTVINALKSLVYTDSDIYVLLESSKALLKIGVWDMAALEVIVQSIKFGSDDLRSNLLNLMRHSENPHLLNKQSLIFKVLNKLLLSLVHSEDERLSSQAALVCAYLDIKDKSVTETLLHYLHKGDEDMKSWTLEALATKLQCHTVEVVMSALKQLQKAVKWDNRANAAHHIMTFRSAIEKFSLNQLVFEELERMLWDDPSKEVREAVSKTIASLGMLNKTLGVVVRKLDDLNEDVRAQGVMSLSILGIKGKSLLNQILDILELDSSIYVRIQVMRAVKDLNIIDRRVIRLLRERARGTGPMCKEAQLALKSLTGEVIED